MSLGTLSDLRQVPPPLAPKTSEDDVGGEGLQRDVSLFLVRVSQVRTSSESRVTGQSAPYLWRLRGRLSVWKRPVLTLPHGVTAL